MEIQYVGSFVYRNDTHWLRKHKNYASILKLLFAFAQALFNGLWNSHLGLHNIEKWECLTNIYNFSQSFITGFNFMAYLI